MKKGNELAIQVHFTEETFGIYEKVQKELERNQVFQAATNVEEAYEAIKEKLSNVTLDSFLALYEKFTDFLQEGVNHVFGNLQKERELTDEELDFVSAGGIFSWIKRNWKKVLVCAVAVTVGAAIGAVTAGVGVGVLGAIGAATGLTTTASTAAVGTAMVAGAAAGAYAGAESFSKNVSWS